MYFSRTMPISFLSVVNNIKVIAVTDTPDLPYICKGQEPLEYLLFSVLENRANIGHFIYTQSDAWKGWHNYARYFPQSFVSIYNA